MGNKNVVKGKSLRVALVAVFAVLYFGLSILPGIPVPGVPGMKIQLEAAIASAYGVLLGPYLGASASLLGTVIAWIYPNPSVFGAIFLLNPAFNALITGFIFSGRWRRALALMAATIVGFWLTPLVQPVTEHWYVGLAGTFDKIAAAALIPVIPHSGWSPSTKLKLLKWSIPVFTVAAVIGNIADNSLGLLIFSTPPIYQWLFGFTLEFTRGLILVNPFIYPIIRVGQGLIATMLWIPLMKAMEALRIPLGVEKKSLRRREKGGRSG